ncbi:hypothetical protein DPMN_169313 [Dreissena polymorpha]|uniref:Uncharacterized protein n=1 Tax=Dreissena polymorpha TaxID=45954 RepID=A0A9D4F888_DREPO|nr:hypothetical protein DPMN_169313 [Dreissena polymorpha]
MRERESIFSDFVSDVRKKEKEEKSQQKEKVGAGIIQVGECCSCNRSWGPSCQTSYDKLNLLLDFYQLDMSISLRSIY